MRKSLRVTVPAGGRWPDSDGGLTFAPYTWLRIVNRAVAASGNDVLYDTTGPPATDALGYAERVNAGDDLVRNLGGLHDVHAEALHILNVGTAAAPLLIEYADSPIVALRTTGASAVPPP